MLGKNFDTAATLRSHLIDQGGISVLFVKLIHLPTRTGRWGAWGAEPPEHLHFVLLRFNIQYFHTEMCYIDPLHFGIIWWQQLDHGSCMVYYIWRRMCGDEKAARFGDRAKCFSDLTLAYLYNFPLLHVLPISGISKRGDPRFAHQFNLASWI
jgi:hypothetical protein